MVRMAVLVFTVALSITATGCKLAEGIPFWKFWESKPGKAGGPTQQEAMKIEPPTRVQPPEDRTAASAPPLRSGKLQTTEHLRPVYFGFDSAALSEEAKKILDQNVQWLRQNTDVEVQIEGHCDERGTVEYNFGLGQRRADAVREFFVSHGISPELIHTISYGEERPVDPGHDEAAWSKNRRVQFLIYRR